MLASGGQLFLIHTRSLGYTRIVGAVVMMGSRCGEGWKKRDFSHLHYHCMFNTFFLQMWTDGLFETPQMAAFKIYCLSTKEIKIDRALNELAGDVTYVNDPKILSKVGEHLVIKTDKKTE